MEVYVGSDDLSKTLESHDYFVEEIPEDEKPFFSIQSEKGEPPGKTYLFKGKNSSVFGVDDKEALIQCVHFYFGFSLRPVYNGDPFFFVFKKGESLKETIDRIRLKLDIEKK